MSVDALIVIAMACVAYANGANDNFKGVATLFGSGTTDYRRALALYRRQLPDGHAYRASAASGLGAVLLDLGRPAEARRYLREGLTQWEAHDPPESERIREVRELLAPANRP